MASRRLILYFVIPFVCALWCSDEECMDQGIAEDGAVLSLLQTNAHAVHAAAAHFLTTPAIRFQPTESQEKTASLEKRAASSAKSSSQHDKASSGPEEVAFVNMIRHGEKCISSGEFLLHPVGYDRAQYLAHCMSSNAPSLAMPFGKATGAMAGSGEDSWRPFVTVLPLAEKLNITLHMPCSNPLGYDCIAEHIPKYLHNRGTLIVADVYQMIPYVAAQLSIPVPFDDLNSWPYKCPSSTQSFVEPACCAKDLNFDEGSNSSFPFEPASTCFDQIWQVMYTRPDSVSPWQAQSLQKLAEGFGGDKDGPCLQGLAPMIPPITR